MDGWSEEWMEPGAFRIISLGSSAKESSRNIVTSYHPKHPLKNFSHAFPKPQSPPKKKTVTLSLANLLGLQKPTCLKP